MRRKVTILDHKPFMTKFFGHAQKRVSQKKVFVDIASPSKEKDMYDALPEALNKSKLCPGFTFVATPSQSDPSDPTNQAVDGGMYPDDHVPTTGEGYAYPPVDWSDLEIPMECKLHERNDDPFEDDEPNHEPTAESRKDTFGQILSYAEFVFQYQHRTFFFMIIFLGDYARIIRFDRSSIFATKKFNYKTETWKLTEFLSRYARLSSVERGHDCTATRIRPGTPLYDKMQKKGAVESGDNAQQLFSSSLDPKWPWWQLEIPVGTARFRRFLVGKPHFIAPGVAGRGTRGYVALPVDGKGKVGEKFVYLKDAWRVDHPGIEQEGSILKELKKKNVRYVPTLVCHGDLPGPEQVTDWRSYWKECHPEENPDDCPLKRHQHYRLVVKEVGKPLDQFGDCSGSLILAILCCLHAHEDAYKAGIIHRDISAGNILLYQDEQGTWVGMLNDWELSKKYDVPCRDARQPDRTGTWQFMSAHALNDIERQIGLEDELESFFHVIIYYAVRFLDSNLDAGDVGQFLHDYFDAYSSYQSGYRCGLSKLAAMSTGAIDVRPYNGDHSPAGVNLKFSWPDPTPTGARSSGDNSTTSTDSNKAQTNDQHPINQIIDELLLWFKALYAKDGANSSSTKVDKKNGINLSLKFPHLLDPKKRDSKTKGEVSATKSSQQGNAVDEQRVQNLKSHTAVIELLHNVLTDGDWPERDRVPDRRPKGGFVPRKDPVPKDSTATTGSKKRSMTDADPGPSQRKRSRA
ncbi:hypothetical protein C8Q80DRAFT_1351432 [Daedaleopsis nitida]|nr:hypothetical protein C8Q80DRAFT_1351432 [Daedaleopsis nitida]